MRIGVTLIALRSTSEGSTISEMKLGIIPLVALAIEAVNFPVGAAYALDSGSSPADPWYMRLVGFQWGLWTLAVCLFSIFLNAETLRQVFLEQLSKALVGRF
jgi:hypothetical protein